MAARKPVAGAVERRVRADVAAIETTHPMASSISEMAYTLARALDEGAGLAVAAVNRELRANLVELTRMAVADDDGLEDRLSTPVLDAPDPEPADARPARRRGGATPR